MADALGDDYVVSDVEVDSDAGSGFEVDGVDGDSDGGSQDGETRRDAKRQRPADDERRITGKEGDERAKKKRKLKERDKARKAKKAQANLALKPGSLSRMPPDMQADHMLKLMRSCKRFKKMTDLELDGIGFKESMIVDTSADKSERTLDNVPAFVQQAVREAAASAKEQALDTKSKLGQPVILFVSGNAQRAAELARALRSLLPKPSKEKVAAKPKAQTKVDDPAANGNGKTSADPPVAVAKLFARHFKISEQEMFLQSHVCPIAVGTPQRLIDLLTGSDDKPPSLKADALQAIVLDATWTDLKKRTLLDGVETRETVVSLLTMPVVQQRLRKTGKDVRQRTRLIFF